MNTWVLNFANSIVGVGILAIPFCFHVCGIFIASLMILATNLITRKTCEYLLKAGQLTRKSGYETLADYLLGPIGKLITELGIIGLLLGTLISFQVVIGDLAPGLINSFFGVPETWGLRTLLMCISCMGVIPLALMRNISSLANMNALSMGFYCIFIVVVFLISFNNVLSGEWMSQVNFWKPSGVFHCLPILSLAFSCQTQVFVMYEAIPEPSVKSMMDIIDRAINLVTVMYLSVGVFGYIAFYEAGIHGDILSNFPNGLLSNAIKTGFWVSIMMSFPLIIFPLRLAIHSLLFSREKKVHNEVISSAGDYIPQHRFAAITLLLIGGTLIVGILIPHIETVLSITGALIGTFLCFVFPAGLYILSTTNGANGRTLSKVIFVIGLICMIASTMAVLSGGSSEAGHQQQPKHEDRKNLQSPNHPVVPVLDRALDNAKQAGQLKVPNGKEDGRDKTIAQVVLTKPNEIGTGAALMDEKREGKADAAKVAPTVEAVPEPTKDRKREMDQKGDTRKLQQVINESKNEGIGQDKRSDRSESKLTEDRAQKAGTNQGGSKDRAVNKATHDSHDKETDSVKSESSNVVVDKNEKNDEDEVKRIKKAEGSVRKNENDRNDDRNKVKLDEVKESIRQELEALSVKEVGSKDKDAGSDKKDTGSGTKGNGSGKKASGGNLNGAEIKNNDKRSEGKDFGSKDKDSGSNKKDDGTNGNDTGSSKEDTGNSKKDKAGSGIVTSKANNILADKITKTLDISTQVLNNKKTTDQKTVGDKNDGKQDSRREM